jgi:hypothetical protein
VDVRPPNDIETTTTMTSLLRKPVLAAVLIAGALSGCVVPPPRPTHAQAPAPAAQPLYFYPDRGQEEERQDRDRYECYQWSVRQTGVDPGMQTLRRDAAEVSTPVPRDPAPVVGGAVTGAVVGAAMSSPRHAGSSMVLGAIFGSMLGAAAGESQAQAVEREQDARQRQWAAREQIPLDNFRRAMSACMGGRGYSVR